VLLRYVRLSLLLMVSAFLGGALLAAAPAAAAPFADTAGASYDPAVTALSEEGVVQGCRDGDFCPDAQLSRGQFASMLVRALEVPASEMSRFADHAESVHAASIDALAAAGTVQGCGPEAFCPDDPITRGQMASMIARAFELPTAPARAFDDVNGVHAAAVDQLAASGLTSGCSASLVAFCPNDAIVRWQAAVFVARAMGLMELVELAPLDDRRAEQEALDAAAAKLAAERAAKAEQEREAAAVAARAKIWDALAKCESGGNWSINTGNGYYGGLQFSLRSWRAVGGRGYPHQHSRAEQILRGERLLAIQGWGAWPACSRKLGYR
jgi:hypothetical protein